MFRPLTAKRKSELVSDEITKAVLSGQLNSGDKLPSERELARQMKVGRAVIRESLRTLEFSGYIDIKQGVDGGIFVKTPNYKTFTRSFPHLLRFGNLSIDDFTEARVLVEKNIIELVMKKNKETDFKLLDDIVALGFSKIERGEKIRKENFAFHLALAELSKNPILKMIVSSIMPIFDAFAESLNPSLDHSMRILEGHRDVLKEMKMGNASGAAEKLENHIVFFAKEFREAMPSKNISFDEISRMLNSLDEVSADEYARPLNNRKEKRL